MFGRKKNNFYRYMFQKSFMPLFAMLVVISMAFLIFFRITVVREKQKNRENDQIRLETCVSSTELHMKEIEKWGKQLLNGVDLQKFVYMYDDLDRYSRFSLQNEIYESVYDLYYKNEQVDSVVLYIPTMGKVITDLHCQTSVKPWMITKMIFIRIVSFPVFIFFPLAFIPIFLPFLRTLQSQGQPS